MPCSTHLPRERAGVEVEAGWYPQPPACPAPPPSLKAEGSLVVSCQLRNCQDDQPPRYPRQTHQVTRRGRVTQQTGSLLVFWFLGMDFGVYFLGQAPLALG